MRDYELLTLYRLKRKYDGFNGRIWDASKHMDYEDDIEKEEQRRKHLTSSSSGRTDSWPKCTCERCTGIPLESLYEDDPHAT